jgi:hypothetical protein
MKSDDIDNIDEINDAIDELKTSVEELREDPPRGVEPRVTDKLSHGLEEASDAADELGDQAAEKPENHEK